MSTAETIRTQIGLGDWPNWINVFLTLIAISAAIYAGIQARGIVRVELKRDKEFERRQKQAQASLISSWTRPAIRSFSNSPIHCIPKIEACVKNNSSQPVFDLRMNWWLSGEIEHTSVIDLIPPHEEICRDMPAELLEKFVGIEGYASSIMSVTQATEDCLSICDITRIEIEFRDAENTNWVRDRNGVLSQKDKSDQQKT